MNRFVWCIAPLALLLSGCVGYGYPGGYTSGGYYGDRYGGSAGYPGGYGSDRGVFRCESNDGRTRECATGGTAVRLVRQLSDAPCVQGRSWGYTRSGVWVSNGCRAEFVSSGYSPGYGDPGYGSGAGYGGRFRCESRDNRTQHCGAGGQGRARLVRQLSDAPCIQGRTWGSDGNGVWVSNGCRGEFEWTGGGGWSGGYGQTVRCESKDNRTRRCDVRVNRGVQLVRQLSDTRCIQGQNWGWDARGIWVSRGCRGEFSVR